MAVCTLLLVSAAFAATITPVRVEPGSTVLLPGSDLGPGTPYTWYQEDIPLNDSTDPRFSGSQTSSLTISDVLPSDSATYYLTIPNPLGGLQTISAFDLKVGAATNQVNGGVGSTIVLGGQTYGDNLDYSWFRNGMALSDGARVMGSQTPSLTISNALITDAGSYALKTDVGAGPETLAVYNLKVSITPAYSTNVAGTDLVLPGEDVGPDFSYQWYFNNAALPENAHTSDTQTPTLSISSLTTNDSGTFTLKGVSGTNAPVALSIFTVKVIAPPVIGTPYYMAWGDNVTFVVQAYGDLLNYQWVWQGQEIPGATRSSMTFTNAYSSANAGFYWVKVSNPAGQVVSDNAALKFTKPAPPGTYDGVFYDTNTPAVDSSGSFQFNLSTSKRSFSGRLSITNASYRFSGAFSDVHYAQLAVPRPGMSPLKLIMQLLTTNEFPQIVGTVSGDDWISSLSATKRYYSSKNPAPQLGKYTLALQNTNLSPSVPNGSPIGTVSVGKDGSVTLSGITGDGYKFSRSTAISSRGDWSIYAPLYKGQGCIVGWLRVRRGVTNSIPGNNLFWFQQPGPDLLYPNGFTLALPSLGSTYTNVLPDKPVLSFTNGVAVFTAGDLFAQNAPIWDFVKVTISKSYTFKPEKGTENVTMSIAKSTGMISGSFIDLVSGKRTSFRGIALQQQRFAPGYFLADNASGYFALVPDGWVNSSAENSEF